MTPRGESLHSSMTEKDPISHRREKVSSSTGTRMPRRYGRGGGTATTGPDAPSRATTRFAACPPMLGEHSVPGVVMPNEGFEEHYEKCRIFTQH
jgi:hypothetical protein